MSITISTSKDLINVISNETINASQKGKVTFKSLDNLKCVTRSSVALSKDDHAESRKYVKSLRDTLLKQGSKVLTKKEGKLNALLKTLDDGHKAHGIIRDAVKAAVPRMYEVSSDIKEGYPVGRDIIKQKLIKSQDIISQKKSDIEKMQHANAFFDKFNKSILTMLSERHQSYKKTYDENLARNFNNGVYISDSIATNSNAAINSTGFSSGSLNMPPYEQALYAAWAVNSGAIQLASDTQFNSGKAVAEYRKQVDEGETSDRHKKSKRPVSEGGCEEVVLWLKDFKEFTCRQVSQKLNDDVITKQFRYGDKLYRGCGEKEANLWMGQGIGGTYRPDRFSSFSFSESSARDFGSGWLIESKNGIGVTVPNVFPNRDENEFLTPRMSKFIITDIDENNKKIFVKQY